MYLIGVDDPCVKAVFISILSNLDTRSLSWEFAAGVNKVPAALLRELWVQLEVGRAPGRSAQGHFQK